MKRRNADTGKLRRPIKRTKITEGMYGNSMLYLKFIIVWASVVLADYMLEFRFEFLWPFWILLRSVYDTYKYQGLAFSVFFICIALTSDMICFFFIPIQYIFFAASTYVWVQFVWYTFCDKGICLPTVAICCFIVYVEGVRGGLAGGAGWGARPLAAHCVGFPAVTLGVGVKKYVVRRLRLRTQRQVRAQNEFYFELMREAVPPSEAVCECPVSCAGVRHVNGTSRKRNKHADQNGHCVTDKSDHIDTPIDKKASRERDKSSQNHAGSVPASVGAGNHSHSNGNASGPGYYDEDDRPNLFKGSGKSSKYDKKEANTYKEEKKEEKKRNKKDKDKENSDSHKSTEHTKEQIVKDKEVESTKDNVRNKESNSSKEKDKEREREKEKERERERDRERELKEREREREREKERERDRERELREARECIEELKRVRAELATARSDEAEARKALAAALAADKLRRTEYNQLKQAHAALQHKVSVWRTGAGAALERKLSEERRARHHAEQMLSKQGRAQNGECDNATCAARRGATESELEGARRDALVARDMVAQMQRDCKLANQQVRALEARVEAGAGAGAGAAAGASAWGALAARVQHLERALSAETRVKLDLLSALGEANRKMQIQDSVINRQDKELEELKAQMLAVMPTDFMSPVSSSASKLRLGDGSPLDPNATVYTPKPLCSDA